jgi:hypothetical protein
MGLPESADAVFYVAIRIESRDAASAAASDAPAIL